MTMLWIMVALLSLVLAEPCFVCTKPAFVPKVVARSKLRAFKHKEGDKAAIQEDMESLKPNNVIGRRQLIRDIGFAATAMNSAAALGSEQKTMTSNTGANVCDSTVESYRKGNKRIHLVGTAHVSSVSANLAGNLVKEVKPDGVFIELDTQRVSRAFRNGRVSKPINLLFFVESNPEGGGVVTLQSASILPQASERRPGLLSSFFNKIGQNPIQQMYRAIEEQGITPGEEFITAVEEGVDNDSIIILGDRRMDFTLIRIAKALLHTDPNKLAEADREITARMKRRMPQLEEWEAQNRPLSKEEFQGFVEQMKTKESTNEFMREMRKAAPDLYNALVGERDVFMGRGMNVLLSSSSQQTGGKLLDTIVAVIGLGHIDGVGKELRSLGWSLYKPPQC